MNWFEEFITIFSHSKKTQWAIILGIVFYICITLLGEHQLANFELHGSLKALGSSIKKILLNRYHEVAIGALFSFWVVAFKCYQKDKKQLWK